MLIVADWYWILKRSVRQNVVFSDMQNVKENFQEKIIMCKCLLLDEESIWLREIQFKCMLCILTSKLVLSTPLAGQIIFSALKQIVPSFSTTNGKRSHSAKNYKKNILRWKKWFWPANSMHSTLSLVEVLEKWPVPESGLDVCLAMTDKVVTHDQFALALNIWQHYIFFLSLLNNVLNKLQSICIEIWT